MSITPEIVSTAFKRFHERTSPTVTYLMVGGPNSLVIISTNCDSKTLKHTQLFIDAEGREIWQEKYMCPPVDLNYLPDYVNNSYRIISKTPETQK